MKKRLFLLLAVLVCCAAGCGGKDTPAPTPTVYSFHGENEVLTLNNGVIVLGEGEESFCGGTLETKEDLPAVSFSTTFYTLSDGERQELLSSTVEDRTGGSVRVEGDLGSISGEGAVTDRAGDLTDGLYFELSLTGPDGTEQVYSLPLTLTEVTGGNPS